MADLPVSPKGLGAMAGTVWWEALWLLAFVGVVAMIFRELLSQLKRDGT